VEANVRTNEEQRQEVEEAMPQIEEMIGVPTKMMEDFIPLGKKCAFVFFFHLFCTYLSSWHVHWQVA
jgi:hypothetical protein